MYLYGVNSSVCHPPKILEGPKLKASGSLVEPGHVGDSQAPAWTFYTPAII